MKKDSFTNLQKYLEMEIKEAELVQVIRQLKDYVILDRKDYEKIVRNNKPEEYNESALKARDSQITFLEKQLKQQEEWTKYWKDKYDACINKSKNEISKWWKF